MMGGRGARRSPKSRHHVRRPHDASLGGGARSGAGLLVKAPERQLALAGEQSLAGRGMQLTTMKYYLSRCMKGVL